MADAAFEAAPTFLASPPRFAVPRGACDCHLHVFGPAAAYPYWSGRAYTPPDALAGDALTMLDRLGLDRAVVVQATPYGTDNARVAAALAELGPRARGVAAVEADVAPSELEALRAVGVRGLRLHAMLGGLGKLLRDMAALAAPVRDLGWHFDLHVGADDLEAVAEAAGRLAAPVVIDHFGGVASPRQGAALDALRRLLGSGEGWVKLSAPYRLAAPVGTEGGLGAVVGALLAANPERLVWGSDWPHTPPHAAPGEDTGAVRPYRRLDTGAQLEALADWVPDRAARDAILARNPAMLYGFAPP